MMEKRPGELRKTDIIERMIDDEAGKSLFFLHSCFCALVRTFTHTIRIQNLLHLADGTVLKQVFHTLTLCPCTMHLLSRFMEIK